MSERRPGWIPLVALQLFGLVQIAVIVAVWVSTASTHSRFGTVPAVAVEVVVGAAGWFVLFHWLERRHERSVEDFYGPRDQARDWPAQMAWSRLRPSARTWSRILYAFAVLAPAVLHLARDR